MATMEARQRGGAGAFVILLLIGMLVVGVAGVGMAGNHTRSRPAPPPDVEISSHAEKHVGQALDAWSIYAKFQADTCTSVRRYCALGRELYLCEDPETGLVGGLILAGDVVITGYGARARYWENKVKSGEWGPCD